eukprot:GEMP01003237.1.p1 GENE.GEMP01003237.1~~GEMP01003237.1.p1  ORF type:complete len:868 (+),score=143.14 GEMP01003237.1:190-2793(+)
MSKRGRMTIFNRLRGDTEAPPMRRPTTFLSEIFNVSPTPTSDSRNSSPLPSPASNNGISSSINTKPSRRSSILTVLDTIAGNRFRKSSVASSIATSSSMTSSRSIRTLKDVKDELQMAEQSVGAGNRRKGSIADLHDSVHATGIVIRDSFGPEPFANDWSVLTVDEEYLQKQRESNRFLFVLRCGRPFSKFMDIVMALITVWTLVWVPLSVAFQDFLLLSPLWAYIDGICSAVYCFGVILSFFTSKPNFALAKEIVDPSAIRSYIFHSPSFYLDLISAVPWMIIAPGSQLRWLLLLRGHRLLRTPLSWEESIRCSAITGLSDFLQMFRVIVWFFLLSHLLGCIWFRCQGEASRIRHVSDVEEHERTPFTFYMQAFRDGAYMLMTRDRPAFTDLELAVVGCMGPSGAFFIIWMTGHFAVLLQRLQALTSKNFEELSLIRAAMDRQRLPKELQFRVLRFHYYSYLQHDVMAYEVLFRSLSTPLTCEIKFWIFRKLIRYVPFFQDASPKAIKGIVLALKLANYSPGDVILRCGDQCSDMYFVIKGSTQVLDAQGLQPIKKLKAGEWFGEFALLQKSPRRRTTWVRADTFCCLAELSSIAFDRILSEFPEQRSLMVSQIKEAIHEDRRSSGLDRIDEIATSRRSSTTSSIQEISPPNRVVRKIEIVLDHIRSMEARLDSRLNTVEQCIRAEAPTAHMTPYNASLYHSRRASDSSNCNESVMSTPKRRKSSLVQPSVRHSSVTGRESLCIPHSIMTQTINEASVASTKRSSQATLSQSFSPKQLQDVLSSRASSLRSLAQMVREEDTNSRESSAPPNARDSDDSARSMMSDTETESRSNGNTTDPRSHSGAAASPRPPEGYLVDVDLAMASK